MSMEDKEKSQSPNILVWIMFFILSVLVMVPLISISMAIQKIGEKPRHRENLKKLGSSIPTDTAHDPSRTGIDLSGMRGKLEEIASHNLHPPSLSSQISEVRMQVPSKAWKGAGTQIANILKDQHRPFVQTVNHDTIMIILILDGSEWPQLSESLEEASKRDGLLYLSPNHTETAQRSGSMVLKIEIVKMG